MNTIKTRVKEKCFLDRLGQLTKQQTFGSKDYHNQDVFVYKLNKNRFRLGFHTKRVFRFDGYYKTFLYGRYFVNQLGFVEIRYYFSKPMLFVFPFLLMALISIPIFFALGYNAFEYGEADVLALVLSGVFALFSLVQLFWFSPKERRMLISHLEKICKTEQVNV